MNKSSEETVQCVCGCTIIKINKFDDTPIEYGISAYECSQQARQQKLKQYFIRLWHAIIGKDYFLYEVIMSENDYKKLMSLSHG